MHTRAVMGDDRSLTTPSSATLSGHRAAATAQAHPSGDPITPRTDIRTPATLKTPTRLNRHILAKFEKPVTTASTRGTSQRIAYPGSEERRSTYRRMQPCQTDLSAGPTQPTAPTGARTNPRRCLVVQAGLDQRRRSSPSLARLAGPRRPAASTGAPDQPSSLPRYPSQSGPIPPLVALRWRVGASGATGH